MKLLIISPYPLFPIQSGGKIRIVQLARHLAGLGIEVTVLTPFHFTQKRELYQHENFSLRQFYYPFLIPFLFTDKPFPYSYLTSFYPGLAFMLKRFFASFDCLQFEHVQFARLLDFIDRSRIICYDAHNVEYDYTCSECAQTWVKAIAGKRIYQLEKKLIDRADHTFVVSHHDALRLQSLYQLPPAKTSLAANGMKPLTQLSTSDGLAMRQRFSTLKQFSRYAIFSGSDVMHNRVAVRFIIEQLAPQLPDYGFIIHGTCGKTFADSSKASNLFFDFDDSHFADYAVANMVALNPITQGSGTNLKIINYLSYGLSTVSTAFGLRGYEELEAYIQIAELTDFARVLQQAQFIRPPSAEFLAKNYSWQSIAENMQQVYNRLIKG